MVHIEAQAYRDDHDQDNVPKEPKCNPEDDHRLRGVALVGTSVAVPTVKCRRLQKHSAHSCSGRLLVAHAAGACVLVACVHSDLLA